MIKKKISEFPVNSMVPRRDDARIVFYDTGKSEIIVKMIFGK